MAAHSTIGPSSAERWMNCPGSVALTATLPAAPTSKYAAEGTLAHTLAEDLVTGKTNILELYERVGEDVEVDGHVVEITEEMVAAAEEYRDIIAETLAQVKAQGRPAPIVSKTEVRLDGKAIDPRLFGTGDHLLYQKGNVLHVFDFKYGKGHAVDAVEWVSETEARPNKQLGAYGVMAMDGEAGWAYNKVVLHIIQPRASHAEGGHRWHEFSVDAMRRFREELVAAVRETAKPKAKLEAGDWCKWCAAKASCPQIVKAMQAQAQVEFSVVPAETASAAALPSVDVLPLDQLARALHWRDSFDTWFKAAEERAQRELALGNKVPGFKLVPGRTNRQWRDEAEVVAKYEAVLGDSIYAPRKIKSPAQLEKLVRTKGEVDALTFKPEAPLKLAKDSDPRAASTPGDEAAKAFEPVVHKGQESVTHLSLEEELGLVPPKKGPIWPT